jgi:hypothetical protein
MKNAKLVVKLISLLGFISAALLLFSAILLLMHLSTPGTVVVDGSTLYISEELASAINTTYILTSIFFIIGAILIVVLNIFLLKFRNWARIIVLIFAVLAIIASFFALWWQILLTVLLYGITIYFLGFNTDVVLLFNKSIKIHAIDKSLKKK